ncbi:MAG TPA: formylglycine-generating enzyme family protein, partial [Anaerolineae bacterium]|nr:formylglycine-generating enzyme family protein [Anaerolineae bacterium]
VEQPEQPTPEVEMVTIPAGEFIMGSDEGEDNEKPAHTVSLEAFEIDKFEVTNEQFARFVEETGYQTDAEKAGETGTWRTYAEGKDNHPVVKVTWNDAVAYCEWAGKRLPTEAEWEKAARGEDGRVYPWGNEWDPAKANTKEGGLRGTAAVGSFGAGASPYGVEDMAGNVWEWTADWYQAYPDSDFYSEYFGEKFRVLRGGGWFNDQKTVRSAYRSSSSPDLRNDDVGFRCAR